MFRHLSPKLTIKDKPIQNNKNNHNHIAQISPNFALKAVKKQIPKNVVQNKQKQIKNINFQPNICKKTIPHIQPTMNIIKQKVEIVKKQTEKQLVIFDDYYQKKTKIINKKDNKQEFSMSGDSYQSQGFIPAKKHTFNTKSNTQKNQLKTNNIVMKPLLANQQMRGGFKSPNNRPMNRSEGDDAHSANKLNFINKNQKNNNAQDSDNSQGKVNINTFKLPTSMKNNKFPLDLSCGQKNKQQSLNSQDGKNKAVPKFILKNNMKSTPYLTKFSLDSSNQNSQQFPVKKGQKAKIQPLLSQLNKQKLNKQGEKSNSFKKQQMFLNLKKRQQQHTKFSKQLSKIGSHIKLKMITNDNQQKQILLFMIRKISQSKHTCIILAYDENTGNLFCLKRIHVLQFIKQKQISEIIRQHKAHHFCMHPHIVRSFATAVHGTYIFQIMEYMQGQTLSGQLKKNIIRQMSQVSLAKNKINQSLTTKISKIHRIKRILKDIASALAYLHQKGIIHRDVKPDNIFISHDTYKLGDLGSCSINGTLQYYGTLDYAAPQILTHSPYDDKIDSWSLGCIAYELDVGRPPFFHINAQQTKKQIVKGQYDKTLISDLGLKMVIDKLLQTRAKIRLSVREFLKMEFLHLPQQSMDYF